MAKKPSEMTADEVRAIRRLGKDCCPHCGAGMPNIKIAERFGLSESAVSRIIHRQARREVSDEVDEALNGKAASLRLLASLPALRPRQRRDVLEVLFPDGLTTQCPAGR